MCGLAVGPRNRPSGPTTVSGFCADGVLCQPRANNLWHKTPRATTDRWVLCPGVLCISFRTQNPEIRAQNPKTQQQIVFWGFVPGKQPLAQNPSAQNPRLFACTKPLCIEVVCQRGCLPGGTKPKMTQNPESVVVFWGFVPRQTTCRAQNPESVVRPNGGYHSQMPL